MRWLLLLFFQEIDAFVNEWEIITSSRWRRSRQREEEQIKTHAHTRTRTYTHTHCNRRTGNLQLGRCSVVFNGSKKEGEKKGRGRKKSLFVLLLHRLSFGLHYVQSTVSFSQGCFFSFLVRFFSPALCAILNQLMTITIAAFGWRRVHGTHMQAIAQMFSVCVEQGGEWYR